MSSDEDLLLLAMPMTHFLALIVLASFAIPATAQIVHHTAHVASAAMMDRTVVVDAARTSIVYVLGQGGSRVDVGSDGDVRLGPSTFALGDIAAACRIGSTLLTCSDAGVVSLQRPFPGGPVTTIMTIPLDENVRRDASHRMVRMGTGALIVAGGMAVHVDTLGTTRHVVLDSMRTSGWLWRTTDTTAIVSYRATSRTSAALYRIRVGTSVTAEPIVVDDLTSHPLMISGAWMVIRCTSNAFTVQNMVTNELVRTPPLYTIQADDQPGLAIPPRCSPVSTADGLSVGVLDGTTGYLVSMSADGQPGVETLTMDGIDGVATEVMRMCYQVQGRTFVPSHHGGLFATSGSTMERLLPTVTRLRRFGLATTPLATIRPGRNDTLFALLAIRTASAGGINNGLSWLASADDGRTWEEWQLPEDITDAASRGQASAFSYDVDMMGRHHITLDGQWWTYDANSSRWTVNPAPEKSILAVINGTFLVQRSENVVAMDATGAELQTVEVNEFVVTEQWDASTMALVGRDRPRAITFDGGYTWQNLDGCADAVNGTTILGVSMDSLCIATEGSSPQRVALAGQLSWPRRAGMVAGQLAYLVGSSRLSVSAIILVDPTTGALDSVEALSIVRPQSTYNPEYHVTITSRPDRAIRSANGWIDVLRTSPSTSVTSPRNALERLHGNMLPFPYDVWKIMIYSLTGQLMMTIEEPQSPFVPAIHGIGRGLYLYHLIGQTGKATTGMFVIE
jgi:hypothetical protein